jgi:cyclophilin family peptidyl-prolyl cis-trans isomerase/HEAT repeat protein
MLCAAGAAGGCASGGPPSVVVVAPPPPPSTDTKVGWILRLEQQRTVRDTSVPATTDAAAAPVAGLRPARTPDLAELIRDDNALVRARAALAVGRVNAGQAVSLLVPLLSDPVADVRATAAFALGIAGDRAAAPALQVAVRDSELPVRGRAVEALGLLGDTTAVSVIVQSASGCPALIAPIEPDSEPPAEALDVAVCRLALFALVRLQAYDGLAAIVLDAQGQPVSRWWPVAYALQRVGDPRAAASLRVLAGAPGVYTAGFALRGLTALKDPSALPVARNLASQRDVDLKLRLAAIRLMAQVGTEEDVRLLLTLFGEAPPGTPLALEVVAALGALARPQAFDLLVDALADPAPAMRAAALAAAAKANPDGFLLVLSGLGRDRDWSVRAALASVLGTLPADRVSAALEDLAADDDARVHAPALRALAAVRSPALQARLEAALVATDFVERATAADLMGTTKPVGGVALLAAAYARGQSDTAYAARAAALAALAEYGGDDAMAVLEQALNDREWPVRARAAALLQRLGRPTATPVRPAPMRRADADFHSDALLHPAYSPHALIETRHGTIEIQLDVVGATLTSATFVELARQGFFNGIRVHRLVPTFVIQAGDPRGDGEGGPGFTMRDELNPTPYLRGTVGMALDWADTGGSQWFIALSPQPHLDGKYTAFGRVVNGWDVLDRISPWDVIERVRIWDGVELR